MRDLRKEIVPNYIRLLGTGGTRALDCFTGGLEYLLGQVKASLDKATRLAGNDLSSKGTDGERRTEFVAGGR